MKKAIASARDIAEAIKITSARRAGQATLDSINAAQLAHFERVCKMRNEVPRDLHDEYVNIWAEARAAVLRSLMPREISRTAA